MLCERSVVRKINISRAEKIAMEASEQSNRISVPEISKIQTLKSFLKNFQKLEEFIFAILIVKIKISKLFQQTKVHYVF